MTRFRNQENLLDTKTIAETRFVIVGAGAIGSMVGIGLSKMGARNITAYDFDTIEDHNFANQMHPVSQLGKAKVDSLLVTAKDFGDCTIVPINAPWTPGNAVDADIIISCVDNMDVRAALWNYYKGRNVFFIDGRMGAFVYKVYGVDASDSNEVQQRDICRAYYESTLHSQADASPEPCGQKSIIYTVYLVAGMMLSQVREFLTPEAQPYRATEVIYDALNHTIQKTYHQETPKMGVITADSEPLEQNQNEVTEEEIENVEEEEAESVGQASLVVA